MAQKETHTEKGAKLPALNLTPLELADVMQKQFAAMVELQKDLFETFADTNRDWSARAKAEAELASELTAKVTSARSVPEAMAICQEWTSRRMALMAEDGRRLLSDSQKFMEKGARLLSNGWQAKSP
jgi:hypothetical protein